MRPRGWALLLIVLLFPAPVLGQEASPSTEEGGLIRRLGLNGSIRGGFWSSSRMLDGKRDVGAGSLWLKGAQNLGPNSSLHFDGWVGRLFDESDIDSRLREGYIDIGAGPIDLRIGQQIIVWGRADRINPTDNLTPRDFTLLVPDDDDQRLGTLALKGTYFIGQTSITAIWLPHFKPNRIPLRPPSPPLVFNEKRPDGIDPQGAFKIDRTGGVVDWSLSYFHGFDLFPDMAMDLSNLPSVHLVLESHEIDVIGADAAATVGRFGFRGEAAYTFTEDRGG
ncbi:MAG TPA: hypothetical protein VIK48_01185, partial [Candidatus Manganitrophaceae bacterium]